MSRWVVSTTTALSLLLAILALCLCVHQYRQTEQQLLASRLTFILNELGSFIQTGLDDLDLQLEELSNLQQRLEQDIARDEFIVSLTLFDANHQVLFSAQAPDSPTPTLTPGQTLPIGWQQTLTAQRQADDPEHHGQPPLLHHELTNNFAQVVGGIALAYQPPSGLTLLRGDPLLFLALLSVILMGLGPMLLHRYRPHWLQGYHSTRQVCLYLLPMTVGMLLLWFLTGGLLQRDLTPLLDAKAEVVSETLAQRVEYAMSLGISLADMVNLDDLIQAMLATDQQITQILISDLNGTPLYTWHATWDAAGETAQPTAHHQHFAATQALMVTDILVGRLAVITTDAYLHTAIWQLALELSLSIVLMALLLHKLLSTLHQPAATQSYPSGVMFVFALALGLSLLRWPVAEILVDEGINAVGLPLLGFTLLGGIGLAIVPWIGQQQWLLVAASLLSSVGLALSDWSAPQQTPWAVLLLGGGLGFVFGLSQSRYTPGQYPSPLGDLLTGLSGGFLLGLLIRAGLGSSALYGSILGLAVFALGLALRYQQSSQPHSRPLQGVNTVSATQAWIFASCVQLPHAAIVLSVPFLLLLPWLDGVLERRSQYLLLASLCLWGQFSLALGRYLTRYQAGASLVSLGGFLGGFALLSNAFSAHLAVAIGSSLLMTTGLGLSAGAAKYTTDSPIHPWGHLFTSVGAVIGPAITMASIPLLGLRESLALAGLVLVIATLFYSVGQLLLDHADIPTRKTSVRQSQHP